MACFAVSIFFLMSFWKESSYFSTVWFPSGDIHTCVREVPEHDPVFGEQGIEMATMCILGIKF